MATTKYVDINGLSRFKDKIQDLFNNKLQAFVLDEQDTQANRVALINSWYQASDFTNNDYKKLYLKLNGNDTYIPLTSINYVNEAIYLYFTYTSGLATEAQYDPSVKIYTYDYILNSNKTAISYEQDRDSYENEIVCLTGNQTIAGIKTFSSIPVCGVTPTSNNHLVNKSYVDTIVGDIETLLSEV